MNRPVCVTGTERATKSSTTRRDANSSRLPVAACQHDVVSIGISDPHLSVLGCWVHVRLLDDRCSQLSRLLHSGIEVIHLEPEEDAMSYRCFVFSGDVGV